MGAFFSTILLFSACAITLFSLSFFIGKFAQHFALSYGIYTISSSGGRVALWGGIAFMLPYAVYAPIFLGLPAGKTVIFFLAIFAFVLFGLLDDLIGFSPLPQILIQAITSLAMLFVFLPTQGNSIWQATLVLFLFFIVSMNAMNWIDGSDAIAGGTFLAALLPLAGLFFIQIDHVSAGIAVAFLGSLSGFLLLNISPAKLHMGTAGSMGLGVFAGVVLATHPNFFGVLLCTLALPFGDAGVVSFQRILAGVFPWQGGDRRHLHYELLDRGSSSTKILFLYTGITTLSSIFGIVALMNHAPFSVFLIPLVLVVLSTSVFKRMRSAASDRKYTSQEFTS